jgi:hypothetical protein
MEKTEYEVKMRHAFTVARLLLDLESLPEMLEAQERSEAFGCFLDPTLWRKGIDALQQHKEIIAALLECQGRLHKARAALAPIFERQLQEAAEAAG